MGWEARLPHGSTRGVFFSSALQLLFTLHFISGAHHLILLPGCGPGSNPCSRSRSAFHTDSPDFAECRGCARSPQPSLQETGPHVCPVLQGPFFTKGLPRSYFWALSTLGPAIWPYLFHLMNGLVRLQITITDVTTDLCFRFVRCV